MNPTPQSPEWSTVLKRGKHKRTNAATQPAMQGHLKNELQWKMGIIGTGAEGNIPVIKTKLVRGFATSFSLELGADTLCAYLFEKLGKSVTYKKILSTHNRFGSFHVMTECGEVAELYDAQLWPAGTCVRRYYEAASGSVPKGMEWEAKCSSAPGATPAVHTAFEASNKASARG